MEWPKGKELLDFVKSESGQDTVMLSFSRGKDSLAAWLTLREHFKVVPVFMFDHWPLLSFVEESLDYYEDFFGTRIIRVPIPSWYRSLIDRVALTPDQVAASMQLMAEGKLGYYNWNEAFQAVRDVLGIDPRTWVATGVRAVDSPNRWSTINKYGPYNIKRDPPVFYPIWDVKTEGLLGTLRRSGVKLPLDYKLFGRTLDGLDHRFIAPLYKYFPDEMWKFEQWHGMLYANIARYQFAGRE